MSALFWLTLTAGLGAILWLPHAAGYAARYGFQSPAEYRDPDLVRDKPLPAWVRRADRVLMNYIEAIVPFAVLVLIAHILLRQPEPTLYATVSMWAQVFFWSRLSHALIYWLGIPYLRSVAFLAGFVSVVAIFLIVLGRLT